MAAQTAITRVESFPFDSKADGYDADGYPVYDRAVGAAMLRSVFEKYFSDGVFGEPADALQIKKAATGLAVTIDPGIFIINGAMGGWKAGSDPVTVTLTPSAPQGNTAYGIMLRYDENDTEGTGRSLSVRVVAGDAASSPQPPAPDQTSPGVMEYRLGYVVVPSGATNMTNATVHNEKGSAVCPYAAPFEKINVSAIMDDVREQAGDNLDAFMDYLLQNIELIKSALDETAVGNLQNQIDALQAAMLSEENLNPAYLEMADSGTLDKKWLGLTEDSVGNRELKDASVGEANLIDLCVTDNKLSYKIQQLLGLFDPSDWGYEEIYSYLQTLDSTMRNGFVSEYATSAVIKKWTNQQIMNVNALLNATGQKTIVSRIDWSSKTLADMVEICKPCNTSALSVMVGKTKNVNLGSFGEAVPFVIIGVNHDRKTSSGNALFTLRSKWIVKQTYWSRSESNKNGNYYQNCRVFTDCEEIYNAMDADTKKLVVPVKKESPSSDNGRMYLVGDVNCNLFILSPIEYGKGGNIGTGQGGKTYEYYSRDGGAKVGDYVDKTGGNERHGFLARYLYSVSDPKIAYYTTFASYGWKFQDGIADGIQTKYTYGLIPAFCIG